MENRLLLLLISTLCVTQATIVQTFYDKMDPGQNVRGNVAVELTTRSRIQCSDRCSIDSECIWYKYEGAGTKNCVLIHEDSADDDPSFSFNSQDIYKKVINNECSPIINETWKPPAGRNGSVPVYYNSFDMLDCSSLMEGTEQAYFPPIQGKINQGISLNRLKRQWVDLGNLTEACIVRPETCGAAGGAVAFWIRITYIENSSNYRGIISTVKANDNSIAYCEISYNKDYIRVILTVLDGYFFMTSDGPSGWTHIVLNYIGPDEGQGIRIYYNGEQTGSGHWKTTRSYQSGDGRVVLGRRTTDADAAYASVDVDELLFFNEALSDQNIRYLSNYKVE